MRVVVRNIDGSEVEHDPALGGFGFQTMACLQCGNCCSRWQAPVNSEEATAIAREMSISVGRFHSDYLTVYPMRPDSYLINHRNGGCAFLVRESGRASCSIYELRPEACRAWRPSLFRKECREGLKLLKTVKPLLTVNDLNLTTEQIGEFCRSLQRNADS
jgi:Fe-S-cluster containining protein